MPLKSPEALKVTATFGKLDVGVRSTLLAAMPGGPSQVLLDAIDDKDKHAVGDIFGMVFQVCGRDKIPA